MNKYMSFLFAALVMFVSMFASTDAFAQNRRGSEYRSDHGYYVGGNGYNQRAHPQRYNRDYDQQHTQYQRGYNSSYGRYTPPSRYYDNRYDRRYYSNNSNYRRYDPYYNSRYNRYNRCDDNRVRERNQAAVAGAVIGGVLGSQMGSYDNQAGAAAVGALAGAALGYGVGDTWRSRNCW